MVFQLDTTGDPRSKVLYPERYKDGEAWQDLAGTQQGVKRTLRRKPNMCRHNGRVTSRRDLTPPSRGT